MGVTTLVYTLLAVHCTLSTGATWSSDTSEWSPSYRTSFYDRPLRGSRPSYAVPQRMGVTTERQQTETGATADEIFRRSGYTYLPQTGGYYKIHAIDSIWPAAKKICEAENAYLFYPESEEEARAVLAFWDRRYPRQCCIYIGITDLLAEEFFTTIHGRSINELYHKWDAGEPNGLHGDEDCVTIRKDGMMNDDACVTNEYPFICKAAVQPVHPKQKKKQVHKNKSFREDYTYLNTTEGFYKLHLESKIWPLAMKQCALEKATLFYPENENEAREVIAFWKRDQPDIDAVHIGISDLIEKGHFETVDGRHIRSVYSNWAEGEPSNIGGDEDCVTLKDTARLHNDRCDQTRPYICKKALEDLPT